MNKSQAKAKAEDREVLRDVFWKMYEENVTQGRHHETQRSTVANLILIVAGATATIIGLDKEVTRPDWPFTVLMFAFSVFGYNFSRTHYRLFQLHMARARNYRDALDALLPQFNLDETDDYLKKRTDYDRLHTDKDPALNEQAFRTLRRLKTSADKRHFEIDSTKTLKKAKKDRSVEDRLHDWWSGFYFFLALFGIVLFFVAVLHPSTTPDIGKKATVNGNVTVSGEVTIGNPR